MSFKIGFLIIPLAASSIVNIPLLDNYRHPNKDSGFSLLPGPGDSSLPISSSFNPSSFSSFINNNDYFNCSRYGPFPLETANNFDVTFEYELNSITSQTIIERIRLFNASNSVVASSSKASIFYSKGTRKSVTFTVPIKGYWTANGLTLKFEICNSSHAVLKAYSNTFYPPSKKTINGATLKREKYISKCLGFYGDGEDMKSVIETFDFTTLGDYVDVDYYYRLNLSKNYFIYAQDYPLNYSSIYLRFNDDDHLFPYFTHQDNDDILIPLTLSRNGYQITFSYKNKFYINKRTLQISDTYQEGFILTSDFYLPINGKRKFNSKPLYLEINRLGFDEISSSIPIKYDIDRSLVGVCTDGGFCIMGGSH